VDGSIGLTGVVTITNSLVGSKPDDKVGEDAWYFENGNWVIFSPGAATWTPPTGITGVIDSANSLLSHSDWPFQRWRQANGNYIVFSEETATWGNGAVGITGVVTTSNSLFFGSALKFLTGYSWMQFAPDSNDGMVLLFQDPDPGPGNQEKIHAPLRSDIPSTGTLTATNVFTAGVYSNVRVLRNGITLICDYEGSGTGGRKKMRWGTIAGLVGGTPSNEAGLWSAPADAPDKICDARQDANPLSFDDGHFVMLGEQDNRGVMTIVDSSQQVSGIVTMTNALFSNGAEFKYLIPLTGTVFLLRAEYPSDHALARRNVFLRVDAAVGVTGSFTSTSGLYLDIPDGAAEDVYVSVLEDGNYVIASSGWGGNRGLVHWASWNVTTSGELNASNSIVGECAGQQIGHGVSALRNGRYVIGSPEWEPCGSLSADLGAVTWMEGGPVTGTVDAMNSIIGDSDSDRVGSSDSDAWGEYESWDPTFSFDYYPPYDEWGQYRKDWQQYPAGVHESGDWSIAVPGWNRGADEDVGAVLSLPGDRRITGTISSLSHLAIYGQGANSGQEIHIDKNDSGHSIASIWGYDDRIYVSRVLWPSLIVHVVGDGTIRGGGIDCGVSCTAEIRYDTPIVLTATANGATPFSGWSGACSGTQSCSVAMTTTTHVTATFGSTSSTPTPTPTATPATATSVPPSPTPTATPATDYVSPRYGPPTTSTVSIISPLGGLTGATRVSVNGVRMFHVVRSDRKIDFTMKAIVAVADPTVDVVLVKAGGVVVTFTQAFTFETPTTAAGTTASGVVLTTTSGVTLTVPPQPAAPITGSMFITYTPVDAPTSPPGDVPLSNFDVQVVISGSPVSTITTAALFDPIDDLTASATFTLPVDPAMVLPGQTPWLFRWIADDGQWLLVPGQTYDPVTGLVTTPVLRLGTYVLVSAAASQWWFPTITLE
jgi:hypothetical protein